MRNVFQINPSSYSVFGFVVSWGAGVKYYTFTLYLVFPLQKGLLEVLYEIFRLPVPIATQDFTDALLSVGEFPVITKEMCWCYATYLFLLTEIRSVLL